MKPSSWDRSTTLFVAMFAILTNSLLPRSLLPMFAHGEHHRDRSEDRMDKSQRNFLTVTFVTLTVMTVIFSHVTSG